MKEYNVALRPIHYACVSGGKDSLFMFRLILDNLEKYPLDMVVNYDLEIDYPFAKNVVNYIENVCNKLGIKFVRLKPRVSWEEIYMRWGYPNRIARWCNNHYKLDCEKQLKEWIEKQNCRPVAYFGFCADETSRFKYEIGSIKDGQDVIYPLAEENIEEDIILEWASKQDIFDNWYKIFRRQGCMGCPMSARKELAYLKLKYPDFYTKMVDMVKWTEENKHGRIVFGKPIKEVDEVINKKWIPKLLEELKEKGVSL